jgi:enoyl-CoA hydratase/carnithine racemase
MERQSATLVGPDPTGDPVPYETILYELDDAGVATVTLNRPDAMNAFNQAMCRDFSSLWADVKASEAVRVVVLRAAGERAFCTGVDVKEGWPMPDNPFDQVDPGVYLGPRQNEVWKPVIAAVNGMAAGGAFYWLNECDIVICEDGATFFDPHVNYGLVAAVEPIGLARRIPLGEALRMALLGLDERIGAERALQIGLVSEIVRSDTLWDRAHELAAAIAAKPPVAVQGTVRAIWESLDQARTVALSQALAYTQIGNPIGTSQVDRSAVRRPTPRVR